MSILSGVKFPVIAVYTSPIYGCKKPTIWIKHNNGMIKLGTFVNIEAAEMFMDYFENKGIPFDNFDFVEGKEDE